MIFFIDTLYDFLKISLHRNDTDAGQKGSCNMKIEKVNDNQIRCTLTREDLDERQLKISEIAYGSEKAKMLFKDMMQQAHFEYGFEAEDIPLMIEAIPMNTGCIVFIITKVEDPEELDTRFSKFAPSIIDDDSEYEESASFAGAISDILDNLPETPEETFDLFRKLSSRKKNAQQLPASVPANSKAAEPAGYSNRLFSFRNLNAAINAAIILKGYQEGDSILYKNPNNNKYYLLLLREYYNTKDFVRICNILMEYGTPEQGTAAVEAYMEEHYSVIIAYEALQALAKIDA